MNEELNVLLNLSSSILSSFWSYIPQDLTNSSFITVISIQFGVTRVRPCTCSRRGGKLEAAAAAVETICANKKLCGVAGAL